MAGLIRDADIALVRERARIEDVIGEHVQLRPAGGGNLRGLCPFHEEKTPSFNVKPSTGVYYCFGCQQGGDVIGFVRAIDGLSFPEAIERLARKAGVTLTYEGGGTTNRSVTSQRQRLLDAHRAAAQFYAEHLSTAPARAGWDFLAARGFDAEVAGHFGVGYAPQGWDELSRHLLARRFTAEELVLGGLAKQGTRGGLVDRFRHRLLWPIRDLSGDVVGFGGRRLAADDEKAGPKYLNSPETPLFKKASLLYGADLARREIARRYQVVVVEGYTDVMACHVAGVTTAVATCGTAFGSDHVGVIRRLLWDSDAQRGEVIFTFDGDAAGQKAAMRAFEHEERFVTQTFVAVETTGLDPCDLRLARGDAAVRELVAARVPLLEFALRGVVTRHDLNSVEGRIAALDAAAPIVNQIKDWSLRQRYAVQLDRWTGFNDEAFVLRRVFEHPSAPAPETGRRPGRDAAGTAAGGPAAPRAGGRAPAGAAPDDAAVIVERETLKIALQHPGLAGPMFDQLDPEVFTLADHRAVLGAIAAAGGVSAGLAAAGDVPAWVGRVVTATPHEPVMRLVNALAVEPMLVDHEVDDRYVGNQIARVRELAVTRRITELKSRVQRLNPVTDPEAFNRDYGELIALEQHKRELRERGLGGP
ncbi:DNA primase [Pseudofrankia inefficax]|uniref:DNA primase n=1 Tax=Pseudofrankia inefficax (strain DSM 45817 / CECT 9037 / DDB 130130 / EuI1c) TaxID=298654 RepID=E3IYX8_PSEI1|nr:DNA primase [Pseudofrankia inefficax]ADP80261.1 DNA primase [Pseudofrankia inefficax]